MKIRFLGAASTVTGSKYLLEEQGNKFLVDCGLFQGQKELRLRNWAPFPEDPKAIKALILTHAHLDHSGYIPLLVKQGFSGPIYATAATRDLCEILLLDAGRIQEEDARHANLGRYSKHKPALPLFTEDDARNSLKLFQTVGFDEEHSLTDTWKFSLSHSGHILGSSFVTLKNDTMTLVFSGDVGRPNDLVMKPPVQIQSADYLVLESTYGDRRHPDVDVLEKLEKIINSTIEKGGSIIIPAFAVGRTQTVLYCIYKLKQEKRIPEKLPVYLDSPMAENVTDLLCRYASEHRLSTDVCAKVCATAEYVRSGDDSRAIDHLNSPAIIISASGMAEGGRVLFHLIHYGSKEENTILFTGFQAAGTRGSRILQGEKEIKIFGQMVPINARIENLDELSSHGDYEELLQWLKGFTKAPKEVFLTHGESGAAEAMKAKIEASLGWKAVVPKYLESFDLL